MDIYSHIRFIVNRTIFIVGSDGIVLFLLSFHTFIYESQFFSRHATATSHGCHRCFSTSFSNTRFDIHGHFYVSKDSPPENKKFYN